MMNLDDESREDQDDDEMAFILILFMTAAWYNSLRNQSKLTRSAVLAPRLSPWRQLYEHGDETSFLDSAGFLSGAWKLVYLMPMPIPKG